jgi:hypothetical protein
LEGRVEELLRELKESRDKLVYQDGAAKNALQQLHRETAYRLEQVSSRRKRMSRRPLHSSA